MSALLAVSGLTAAHLTAIADLERRVVAHDGGRLKLEYGVLEERSGEQPDDLLCWDGDQLVGFLGLYAFGPPDLELAGMVDPAHRRRGIGSRLLAEGLRLSKERGYARALIVASPAGRPFAEAHGAELSHAEHFLVLGPTPMDTPTDPAVTCRQAERADVAEVERLHDAAFGRPATDVESRLLTAQEQTLVVELAGTVVGTTRLTRHAGIGAVYGFAVDPAYQGRGIGRDVLARWCRQLRSEGYERVTLEVEVANEHALGLYLSTGFVREATEEYWALDLRPSDPRAPTSERVRDRDDDRDDQPQPEHVGEEAEAAEDEEQDQSQDEEHRRPRVSEGSALADEDYPCRVR